MILHTFRLKTAIKFWSMHFCRIFKNRPTCPPATLTLFFPLINICKTMVVCYLWHHEVVCKITLSWGCCYQKRPRKLLPWTTVLVSIRWLLLSRNYRLNYQHRETAGEKNPKWNHLNTGTDVEKTKISNHYEIGTHQ